MITSPLAHPDILSLILTHADTATLSRCMRVSWQFYDLSAPMLYSNITIIPNNADSFLHGASHGPIILDNGTSRDLKRDLLKLVRIVNIRNHQGCSGFAGNTACTRWRGATIDFPNLETLKVWVGPSPFEGGWFNCPWVPNFNPRTLVMRDVSGLSAGGSYTFAPRSLLCKVRKVVVVIKSLRDLSMVNDDVLSSRKPTPEAPLEMGAQTVLVLWTDTPDDYWGDSASPPRPEESAKMIDQIVLCAISEVDRLTICNAGQMHRGYLGGTSSSLTYDEVEDSVESAIRTRLEEVSRRRKEAGRLKDRSAALRFMSFGEYLRNDAWKGEFDEQEVKAWMRSHR
ncbi:hypothetical protein IAR55_003438 [Kwoniella newhampshirensis]|uniref:F-box domain-containing protein n=1 Tax=Kwoniella newhampshirensis TaxID=1651941 RepID=A0AAW0YZG1_9TREE